MKAHKDGSDARTWRTYSYWVSTGLAGLGFCLGSGGLIDWLSGEATAPRIFWTVLGFVAYAALSLVALRLGHNHIHTPPQVTQFHTEQEEKDNAKRGLIVLVSLYNPEKTKPSEPWGQLAERKDWKGLRLDSPQSNLWPAIRAILFNKQELEHVWFVATEDSKVLDPATGQPKPGSGRIVPALVRYLEQDEHGMKGKVSFHDHTPYLISVDDDMGKKAYARVQQIFREAHAMGLGEEDIRVDVTGGTGLLTIGTVLACSDEKRQLQFMCTQYDAEHKPNGLLPVVVDYKVEAREA